MRAVQQTTMAEWLCHRSFNLSAARQSPFTDARREDRAGMLAAGVSRSRDVRRRRVAELFCKAEDTACSRPIAIANVTPAEQESHAHRHADSYYYPQIMMIKITKKSFTRLCSYAKRVMWFVILLLSILVYRVRLKITLYLKCDFSVTMYHAGEALCSVTQLTFLHKSVDFLLR